MLRVVGGVVNKQRFPSLQDVTQQRAAEGIFFQREIGGLEIARGQDISLARFGHVRKNEAAFASGLEWSRPSASGGLVEAGLKALLTLLKVSD